MYTHSILRSNDKAMHSRTTDKYKYCHYMFPMGDVTYGLVACKEQAINSVAGTAAFYTAHLAYSCDVYIYFKT